MSRKRFVQAVIARSLPAPDKREAALAYALELWAWLTAKGYGDDKPAQPRVSDDWMVKLSARQQRWFSAFWLAFAYKKGKNEAAMRWYQLGELSDADYQQIIDAADKEAKRERPQGQARKEAQGWLHAKRYLDYQATPKHAKTAAELAINSLSNELTQLNKLYAAGNHPALLPQIEKLEAALAAARKTS